MPTAGSTLNSSLVASKISAIHQVVKPGAWPGAINPATNEANEKVRESSSPKVLSTLEASAKNTTSIHPYKSNSVTSPLAASSKIGHANEKCDEPVAENNNISTKYSGDLNKPDAEMSNGDVVTPLSITTAGAVLAAATLVSPASTNAAVEIISPNSSVRRNNSKQKQNQTPVNSKYKGIMMI